MQGKNDMLKLKKKGTEVSILQRTFYIVVKLYTFILILWGIKVLVFSQPAYWENKYS